MSFKTIRLLAAICIGSLATACGGGTDPNARTLLDAAAVFRSHPGALSSIRAFYPGPYEGFTRIPARDPAEMNRLDTDFLQLLREDLPVEFVDFFPIGNSGKDEIDVVLWRYQSGQKWITVSLVWFGMPMTLADDQDDIQAFETCDETALEWLKSRRSEDSSSAFCRLDDYWHAYQKVE